VDHVADLVRDPDSPLAEGHARDPGPERDRALPLARASFDAPEVAAFRVGGPDRPRADGKSGEAARVQLDAPRDPVDAWVDLGEVVSLGQPHLALSHGDVLRPHVVDVGDDTVRAWIDARDGEVGIDDPHRVVRGCDVLTAQARDHGEQVPARWHPELDRVDDETGLGVQPRDAVGQEIACGWGVPHPDAPCSDGDVRRRRRRAERSDQCPRLGIDLRDRTVVRIDDPDAALADRDRRRSSPERHTRDDFAGLGIKRERTRGLDPVFAAQTALQRSASGDDDE